MLIMFEQHFQITYLVVNCMLTIGNFMCNVSVMLWQTNECREGEKALDRTLTCLPCCHPISTTSYLMLPQGQAKIQ